MQWPNAGDPFEPSSSDDGSDRTKSSVGPPETLNFENNILLSSPTQRNPENKQGNTKVKEEYVKSNMDSSIVKIKQFEYMKVTGNIFSVSDAWPFVTWEVSLVLKLNTGVSVSSKAGLMFLPKIQRRKTGGKDLRLSLYIQTLDSGIHFLAQQKFSW